MNTKLRIAIFNAHGAADAIYKVALVEFIRNGSRLPGIMPEFLGFIDSSPKSSGAFQGPFFKAGTGMEGNTESWPTNWKRPRITTKVPDDIAVLTGFTHIMSVTVTDSDTNLADGIY
jgi:hypothetical protein